MSAEEDSVKQPKRRGRPPGKHKTTSTSVEQQPEQQAVPGDDQLRAPVDEDHLSPFSRFLGYLLRHDSTEIARIASELDVAENTIYRWLNGISEPRPQHLKDLIEALPDQRRNLTYVIEQAFPGVLETLYTGVREVQKDIYRRVLELVATTVEADGRYWQITQTIFEYILLHLDSERRGISVTYAKPMPAREDGIHSLYEAEMRGNFPWPFTLESKAYLGSTTLAGTAAQLQQLLTLDDLDSAQRLQFQLDEFEESACAYPVMRFGRLAGTLVISSTQPDFFADPIPRRAVVEYARLLALGLADEDFHSFSELHLSPMPDLKWQRAELNHSYANRVVACARKLGLSRNEAELYVRREMEVEFEEIERIHTAQQQAEEEKYDGIRRQATSGRASQTE